MALIIIEEQKIIYPTFERIERLKSAGIETDGNLYHLTEIMDKNGFKTPVEANGGFKFELIDDNGVIYTHIYLNFVDAIAEKLILITT